LCATAVDFQPFVRGSLSGDWVLASWLWRCDLSDIVQSLTARDVRVDFVHEHLSFTDEDSPMATLMVAVMGTVAEFERALIRERKRERIDLAKQRDAYRGSGHRLPSD
jgi:DNA invertase Pin-like site-specific DNA recombinase